MGKEEIADLFQHHGPVSFRRMFGGTAIYVGPRIVGMELDGALMVKGDPANRAAYEAGGLEQWGYSHAKTGKRVMMPYWTLPAEALDDTEQLQHWVDLAWQAAQRSK